MVRKTIPLKPKRKKEKIFDEGLRIFAAKKSKITITKKVKK
ncbi:hypothetical protein LCGC14_1893600 [marine sediment metagenome]|uniref:Uncharacterized protein n=1 Tax=marine sediment metagenome TaxID=412755 RepID=A0A0F9FYP7_9ZZZZ